MHICFICLTYTRTIELFKMLEEEGFDRAKIDRIHTPIGLAIGAETPKEIAISILAELIQQRSSRSVFRCFSHKVLDKNTAAV